MLPRDVAVRGVAACVAIGGGLWACGCAPHSAALDASVDATPIPIATQLWARGLVAPEEATRALPAGRILVVVEPTRVLALDEGSGRERWRREGLEGDVALLRGANDAVAADAKGHVVRLRLADGSTKWRTDALCNARNERIATSRVEATAESVFVGCRGGRLFRLDARTGKTRAVLDALAFEGFDEITPLPLGALAVAGWTSGATLLAYVAVLRATDLHELVSPRLETLLVGAVGDTAVLDDLCCNGRTDTYRPATIVNVDLRNGATSEPLDLRPDPDRFPPKGQGPGQGWNGAAIVGTHLFLGIAPMLYDYGDARAPAREPERLLTNLVAPPRFLADGSAYVAVQAADGTRVAQLLDLNTSPIRVRARLEIGGSPLVTYNVRIARGAMVLSGSSPSQISPTFVRISDGAEVSVPAGCGLVGATETAAYASCAVHGGTFVRSYVAKFALPSARAPAVRSSR
jgi:hypothetical protein